MQEVLRPSREVLADIKVVTSTIASLTAAVRRYSRLKATLSKESESLKDLINELEVIIKETGGTREQIAQLAQYRKREDLLPELQKNNDENLAESQKDVQDSQRQLESLNKELEESLIYEEYLKERLQYTFIEAKDSTNEDLVDIKTFTVLSGTELELLGYDGNLYAKIGSIPEPIGNLDSFTTIDYAKVVFNSGNKSAQPHAIEEVGPLSDSPTPHRDFDVARYTKQTYNFDLTLSVESTFILSDTEFYHTDGSIWALVSVSA